MGGDVRRKFVIKHLKETNLGVAQPFLTPKLKETILNFDCMNRVNKTIDILNSASRILQC